MPIVEPEPSEAVKWLRGSLAGGMVVSSAVLDKVKPDGRHSRMWVSGDKGATTMPELSQGGVARWSESSAWIEREIARLASEGANCLLVEDNFSRPSDPVLGKSRIPFSFLDQSVFSWCALPVKEGEVPSAIILTASSGYPTNAFVLSVSTSELGLKNRKGLASTFPAAVADAVRAVIVSVHDGESYLLWEKDHD